MLTDKQIEDFNQIINIKASDKKIARTIRKLLTKFDMKIHKEDGADVFQLQLDTEVLHTNGVDLDLYEDFDDCKLDFRITTPNQIIVYARNTLFKIIDLYDLPVPKLGNTIRNKNIRKFEKSKGVMLDKKIHKAANKQAIGEIQLPDYLYYGLKILGWTGYIDNENKVSLHTFDISRNPFLQRLGDKPKNKPTTRQITIYEVADYLVEFDRYYSLGKSVIPFRIPLNFHLYKHN